MKALLVLCCSAAIGATLGCGASPRETEAGPGSEALKPFAFLIDWQAEPGRDAGYVEASLARVCELVGGDVGLQTAAGWQNTIDVYVAAGLLEGLVEPGDVLPDWR